MNKNISIIIVKKKSYKKKHYSILLNKIHTLSTGKSKLRMKIENLFHHHLMMKQIMKTQKEIGTMIIFMDILMIYMFIIILYILLISNLVTDEV